jgi:hypothetical protein
MKAMRLLQGIGIGAALMYALDPQKGRERRESAREMVSSLMNNTNDTFCAVSNDMSGRVQSLSKGVNSLVPWKSSGMSKTNRVLTGIAGTALAAYALRRRGIVGSTLGTVGIGMLTKGFGNGNRRRRWF